MPVRQAPTLTEDCSHLKISLHKGRNGFASKEGLVSIMVKGMMNGRSFRQGQPKLVQLRIKESERNTTTSKFSKVIHVVVMIYTPIQMDLIVKEMLVKIVNG
jgi:hypothetical protein